MTNSAFDPDEVESERTVIISEREGHENDPEFWLGEEVQATAFKVFYPPLRPLATHSGQHVNRAGGTFRAD